MDDLLNFKTLGIDPGTGVRTWVIEVPEAVRPRPVWPGLWELSYPDEDTENPFFRYGVNNDAGEFFHLWRAMAWALAGDGARWAAPTYYRDETAARLGIEPAAATLVRWEYEVDTASSPCDFLTADRGYVAASACIPIRPEPTEQQARLKDRAGLFALRTFEELNAVEVAISGDASSEFALYGSGGEARINRLVEILDGQERPQMAQVLDIVDVFVDLAQVRDLGYEGGSYLLVRSRWDLGEHLTYLGALATLSWERYVGVTSELVTWADFHEAMHELTSVVLALKLSIG